MYNNLEVAIGGPRSRGSFIHSNDFARCIQDAIDAKKELYRSVYTYDDLGLSYAQTHNSIAKFAGARDIDKIPIDIDKGQNSDQWVLAGTQALAYYLTDELDLQ